MKKAVVLLSGGLDSSTALAMAVRDGFEAVALTVQYGQRHEIELDAAKRVARAFGVGRHEIVQIPLNQFGGSALTDNIDVPKDRDESEMQNIPVTYVDRKSTRLNSSHRT